MKKQFDDVVKISDLMDAYIMNNRKKASSNLRKLKNGVGLTNSELGILTGIGCSQIYDLEKENPRVTLSFSRALAIKHFFKANYGMDISLDYLFGLTDDIYGIGSLVRNIEILDGNGNPLVVGKSYALDITTNMCLAGKYVGTNKRGHLIFESLLGSFLVPFNVAPDSITSIQPLEDKQPSIWKGDNN